MKLKAALAILLSLLFLTAVSYAERAVKVKPKKDAETQALRQGTNYYAIVIGNNNYRHLPKLKTAVTDATEVEKILKSLYGFKTKLLLNATRKDILSTVNDFRKQLGANDNLLIYYAGHGEYDKTADKAYWLPVDAQRDDPVDWIIADDLTSNIKRIASKHILIVSDSCYSGTLTRAVSADLATKGDRDHFIKKMAERPSRTLMASGGNEPVADSGGGKHSVFAAAFLKALNEATDKGAFTAEELFHGRVKEIVAGKSDQVPEYNNVKNSGHEGGDFVFQLAKAMKEEPYKATVPFVSSEVSEETKKLQEEAEKLKKEREELEQAKAIMEEKKRLEEERKKLEREKQELAMAPAKKFIDKVTGAAYTDSTTNMEFVYVKGGCYQMGDVFGDGHGLDEKPVHEVCVDDYYIGKYEVTQGQWKAIMGNNPSYFKNCGDDCPVEGVSWNDIKDFINRLNNRSGGGKYRLPTEAEWEYAARSGGKSEKYSGGSDVDSVAWHNINSGNKKHQVGTKQPNGLGLYDMSGNVSEWVNDWYDSDYYKNSPRNNPVGPNSGSNRVCRGGGWASDPRVLRAAFRVGYLPPGDRGNDLGFRLLRTR
ncbi:MAG: SUMF1/EgtB/PvdO family nonheme iron enzyme [Nitrospirae bacterium]|nr:SUMF1/EgtB/PvdO family nonheme iron enzyme [Nitrospirota bacterium]